MVVPHPSPLHHSTSPPALFFLFLHPTFWPLLFSGQHDAPVSHVPLSQSVLSQTLQWKDAGLNHLTAVQHTFTDGGMNRKMKEGKKERKKNSQTKNDN